MASQIDAYNLALTFLDISDTVQSLNDNSAQAGVLNRWWDYARKRVLEFCWWDFATKSVALSLQLDQSTLALQSQLVFPGWRYIYGLPGDCLRPLVVTTQYGMRLNPFTRSWWYDMSQAPQWGPYRPPWRKANNDGTNPNLTASPGQIILTDQDSAWLVYVQDVTNVALWSQAFLEAVAWNMAYPAAGPLSANQNAKKLAREESKASMIRAMSLELNESQPDPYPDSPAITARN
jgi:hypothetical protein